VKRPTLHDVAAEASVSIKTVSRVINAEANVSDGVRQRVLAAVEKLQYVPNTLARSLKVGLGDTIGVVIDAISDPFFASLTSAAEVTALESGLNVVFGSTGYEVDRERRQVERMVMQQVRGLVLAPVRGDHAYLTRYRESVPVVLVDRSLEIDGYDTVVVDDYGASKHAVQHLLSRGHRKIVFMGGDQRYVTTSERRRGYHDCLAEVGVAEDPDLVSEQVAESPDGEIPHAEAAMLRMIERRPDVTAVFSANTRASQGVVHALHSIGRTDLAMVSFGDFPLAGTLDPGVTCVDQDPRLIGEVATARLLARLGFGDSPLATQAGERVVVPTKLVERGSGEIEVPR
jgi:LacI family transcriptional regulator